MSGEHKIQNAIRNALAGECLLFRGNVGSGWTSNIPSQPATRTHGTVLEPGDIVLRKARRFSTGLPDGFTDTFGVVERVITADMIGDIVGVYFAPEIKDVGKNPSPVQRRFITAINSAGGVAGVVRSVPDSLALLAIARGAK